MSNYQARTLKTVLKLVSVAVFSLWVLFFHSNPFEVLVEQLSHQEQLQKPSKIVPVVAFSLWVLLVHSKLFEVLVE